MTIDTPRATEHAAVPRRGEQIPSFSGRTPEGGRIGTRDFYMRRNLALVFTHGPECAACRALLRELAAREEAVRAEAGETLAVIPGELVAVSAMSEGAPYPVVVDGDLAIHARYGLIDAAGKPRAAVFAVDRYGTVFEPSVADADHAMMTAEEVPGWLEFIACRCS